MVQWKVQTDPLQQPSIEYYPQFLEPSLCQAAQRLLLGPDSPIQYLTKEQSRVRTPTGALVPVPRQVAAYSNPGGLSYRFSGATVLAREEKEIPLLFDIRQQVEKAAQSSFNFVLINYYSDGDQTIGWHSDDEKDMLGDAVIASWTLGAARDFQFRLKQDHSVKCDLTLENNSLLLMKPPTNRDWQHQLPRRARIKTPRLNFTFRQFKPQKKNRLLPPPVPRDPWAEEVTLF